MAVVMNRLKLRRIQKAVRPHARERDEVADPMRAGAEVHFSRRRPERAVAHGRTAGWLGLIEPRFGHDVNDETGLVAVLGGRDSSDDFHRLHSVLGNLIRVQAALLIRDGLIVDRELRLRVIANGMKESVGVRHDAR